VFFCARQGLPGRPGKKPAFAGFLKDAGANLRQGLPGDSGLITKGRRRKPAGGLDYYFMI
jgi:hypothetical protein